MRYGGLLFAFIAIVPMALSIWWWFRETKPGRRGEEWPMLAMLLFISTIVIIAAYLTLIVFRIF
ncbi:MAG: hypothetical protein H0W72_15145 [Planctomycetes bacterium]|nr:hypothetical protein [Planctomycetota bacterium]